MCIPVFIAELFTRAKTEKQVKCPPRKERIKKMWHIYMESRKNGTEKNLFTGQQWRNRHREQTYGLGDRGEAGEMYGKSNMENFITIHKIDS